jgi:hypothetical protein
LRFQESSVRFVCLGCDQVPVSAVEADHFEPFTAASRTRHATATPAAFLLLGVGLRDCRNVPEVGSRRSCGHYAHDTFRRVDDLARVGVNVARKQTRHATRQTSVRFEQLQIVRDRAFTAAANFCQRPACDAHGSVFGE